LVEGVRFIGYRIARIWPLHLVTLAVALLVRPAEILDQDLQNLWAVIPLVHAWIGSGAYTFSGNAVSWTISVELAFYLLFPVLTALSTRAVVVATAALTALACVWAYQHRGVALPSAEVSAVAIYMTHPMSFLCQFSAGMLACRWFMSRDWPLSFIAATALEVFALMLALLFYVNADDLVAALWSQLRPPAIAWLAQHLCAIVFMLPLIFTLAIGRGAVSRMLTRPILVYLGEISFAIYMCHAIIIAVVLNNDNLGLMTYLGAVFVVSVALYHGLERPAQRLIRRRVDAFLQSPTAARV